jgi:hypothetical protein
VISEDAKRELLTAPEVAALFGVDPTARWAHDGRLPYFRRSAVTTASMLPTCTNGSQAVPGAGERAAAGLRPVRHDHIRMPQFVAVRASLGRYFGHGAVRVPPHPHYELLDHAFYCRAKDRRATTPRYSVSPSCSLCSCQAESILASRASRSERDWQRQFPRATATPYLPRACRPRTRRCPARNSAAPTTRRSPPTSIHGPAVNPVSASPPVTMNGICP